MHRTPHPLTGRPRTTFALATFALLALATGCAASSDDTTPGAAADVTSVSDAEPTSGPPADPTEADPTEADATDSDADASGETGDAGYPSAVIDEPVDDPRFDALQGDMVRRAEAAGLPGTSLLVLHDGELVEQEAWGDYTLDTVVPIASASKWLTAAVIMTLVDDGRIDLDAPIRTYLPDTPEPAGSITTRQLMAFTSGVEYDERIGCYQDKTVTLADCNAQILALPLLGRPGTGYRYTGTHLHVAAGVAEAVTGQTFEELFQERIAGPLGMDDTTFTSPVRQATATDGHPQPAGSAFSSLGDYGRFLELLVHDGVAPDGTRILSSEAIAAMAHDQTGDARFVSAARHRKVAETPYGIGHWLDVVDADGNALVESSPGAFGFRPWIDHANGIAGVHLIFDQSDERVEDSPFQAEGITADVQTSGGYVLEGVAEALGGELPQARRGGEVRPTP